MNKAAFLDILNHVTSISEQEVVELEKLALNFPYCQSAHLLLAKAAYDKGSMLSNQRLRRAAACAANRQLLKKLINTAGHHLVLEPIAEEVPEESLPGAPILFQQHPEQQAAPETQEAGSEIPAPEVNAPAEVPTAPVALPEPIEAESLELEEYDAALVSQPQIEEGASAPHQLELEAPETALQESLEMVIAEPEAPLPEPGETITAEPEAPDHSLAAESLSEKEPPVLEPIEPEPLELESLSLPLPATPELPEEAGTVLEEEAGPAPQPQALQDQALPGIYGIPELPDDSDVAAEAALAAVPDPDTPGLEREKSDIPVQIPLPYAEDFDDLFRVDYLASVMPFSDPVTAFVNSLPVQEEAIEAFAQAVADLGLEAAGEDASALPPAEAGMENLAGQQADETLVRFDNFLFSPEQENAPAEAPAGVQPFQEEIIYKVFDSNELGYWMDSSRLGETLLKKNELATSQPYYFRPELLLEYSRHNEMASYQAPEPSILARQFDIIDQFLKLNPKIKSRAQVKIKPESQEDLSLKSTKIRKNTASETLATILVQQGKIRKAIKIYEHLMLKLPEKKDYFASQIEKLQKIN